MCNASGAGSYPRLMDFMHHSTLGLSIIKKRRRGIPDAGGGEEWMNDSKSTIRNGVVWKIEGALARS